MKAEPDQKKLSLLHTSEMFQGCLQCQFNFYTNEDHIGVSYFSRGAHRRSALERHGRDQLPTSGSSEGCRSFLISSHHYCLQQNLHHPNHIRQDIILIFTNEIWIKGNVVIVHDFWSHLSHAHPCTAQWTAGWCPQWGGVCHWLPHSFSEDFSVRKQTWKVRVTCWAPFSIVRVRFLSLCPLYFPEQEPYLLCLHCWCSATPKSSCPLPDKCFFPKSQWEKEMQIFSRSMSLYLQHKWVTEGSSVQFFFLFYTAHPRTPPQQWLSPWHNPRVGLTPTWARK